MILFEFRNVVCSVIISLLVNKPHASAASIRKHGSVGSSRFHLSTIKSSHGNVTSLKRPISEVQCFTQLGVNSRSDPKARCPEACPFYAEDKAAGGCTFQCVTADKCAALHFRKPIASKELGICRSPRSDLPGCAKWFLDGTKRCKRCKWGWDLNQDGRCVHTINRYEVLFYVLLFSLLILVALLVAWIVDLACRPCTNMKVLEAGLQERESMKVHGKVEKGFDCLHALSSVTSIMHITDSKEPFPLSIDLCSTMVAGPGLVLHFNFQVAIIVWALMVGLGWVAMTYLTGHYKASMTNDSSRLEFGTPRDNCILVEWGHENQVEISGVMIVYLWIVYVSSFLLALAHSIRQLRLYHALDNNHKTMRDFAAQLIGLPALPGTRDVENDLKTEIQRKLGFDVVGVSIAWDFKDRQDEVTNATVSHFSPRPMQRQASCTTGFRTKLYDAESSVLAKMTAQEYDKVDVPTLLAELKSSDTAIVIFNTEADMISAVKKVKSEGMDFEGCTLALQEIDCGPDAINWQNFAKTSRLTFFWRCLQGFGSILLGLVIWALLFYAPYALSVYNFNYEDGNEPGFFYSMAFSLVVVAGNQIMYQICDRSAVGMEFRFKDSKESAYMLFYLLATLLPVLFDYVCMYYISWQIMEGLNFHTYDGRHLFHVGMFPEGFQTYPLQLKLAQNIFAYAWPSTYLIPFVLEPFLTNLLPLQLAKLLVRTHEEVTPEDATLLLTPFTPMDTGRYADILLNVMIFLSMLYFPDGYFTTLSILLAACHVFIYAWDHYRVLRIVPKFQYASMDIDWWSQAMLAPCCGFIAGILVYKIKNASDTSASAQRVVFDSFAAIVLHCIIHITLLVYIVPLFGKKHEDKDEKATYDELCKESDGNWFNLNPVHHLRMEYRPRGLFA